jgi:hypothetical protein
VSTVIDELRTFMPLTIAAVDSDPDGISLTGSSWRLRINTNWRLLSGGQIANSSGIMGSETSSSLPLDDLIGDDIIDFSFQSSRVGLDLSAVTSRGHILEIFSDFPYGEWTFSRWNGDDPQRIPIYDRKEFQSTTLRGPFRRRPDHVRGWDTLHGCG